ncbi:hypothetical protein CDAR_194531 [Caerostris darwini]|uniref:Uncharacterized protein n=1 Tax=Caerostris darwini TaxID=1538125 RepID=A0AAV4X5E5_9ARAC|nr:hypothetical protein CDAR_194531 [Caerostris darwini]
MTFNHFKGDLRPTTDTLQRRFPNFCELHHHEKNFGPSVPRFDNDFLTWCNPILSSQPSGSYLTANHRKSEAPSRPIYTHGKNTCIKRPDKML